jgi:H+/gluconate symporter-like permease
LSNLGIASPGIRRGGAFNGMLIDSGIGKVLAAELAHSNLDPLVLAWLVAGLMHFAVGSATVAMMSAAGMVMPLLASHPALSPELMVVAVGAGATGWTHVTASAFWVVKEYLGVPLSEALRKFTVGGDRAGIRDCARADPAVVDPGSLTIHSC